MSRLRVYRPIAKTARAVAAAATFGAMAFAILGAGWPMFGYDAARSGYDRSDHSLSPANVGKLRRRWQIALGDVADSTPVYLLSVSVGGKAMPMLFQTAKDGTTYGIEAGSGKIVWRFATHGPNITTSTPAADPTGHTLYVPGVDGFVHELDPSSGTERRGHGFPVRITAIPTTEKDASPLSVAGGYLYAVTSGYFGDAPPYDGHLVAVRLGDGTTRVFNSLCSNVRTLPTSTSCSANLSGIWARAGAVVDPDPSLHGRVYVATGNGNFNASSGGHDYGDSVIALSRDGSRIEGYYTPSNYAELESGDTDLGSTAPALLPREAHSRTPLLAVQGGKDALLRLLDRAHLGGLGGELQHVDLGDRLFSAPAVWNDGNGTSIIVGLPSGLKSYRLRTDAQGVSHLVAGWTSHLADSSPEGTSPVIVNGVVFVASSGAVLAFDARTGASLWSSASDAAGGSIGDVHWESPIAVNGAVYCSDEGGHLTAYTLPH
ncbi:MAG: PQQ-binding-like beta-propeller repeat protein [Candidatus Eremiobacteraeota bacterium]|nr:PQQ-binding-like beta-propeller repeat protein [Candidatus Eremiobacteraeota bacterium]MBC5802316.1 PQQ-binding-like beta-propeller repeat protein [Candidatus Eremiobacteraeota bacterium]MBC5820910.1 PQQ-binding-like beta-propeller repeat protein [Candidatus Eremiobacteraeota bacterium]